MRFTPLRIGIVMLMTELLLTTLCAVFNLEFAKKLLSMVIGNHIGGRLAFITVGLENGLSPSLIIPIILFYNTTYVLIMYSLFVFISAEVKRFRWINNFIQSLQSKAQHRRQLFKKWNHLSIFVFVWIPLPWTGAAVGSYIAHLEGYSTKQTLKVVLPAMWIGVISWTLWFEELYRFIQQFGRGKTMIVTLFLLIAPLLLYVFNLIFKNSKKKSPHP